MNILSIALVLNIALAIPVLVGLLAQARWTIAVFGQVTPARGMVLAQILAVLASSILFLFWPLEPAIITLLALQITAGVLQAFTIRVLTNPGVIALLLLSALHTGLLVLHTLPPL